MLMWFFQTEECKTTYKKDCFIEYEARARSEKIEMCHTIYARECDKDNAAVRDNDKEYCSTEHDTGTVLIFYLPICTITILTFATRQSSTQFARPATRTLW